MYGTFEDEDYIINSDEPKVAIKQDLFSRAPFANRISELICERKESDSLVIGIYGEWGSGKTTLMNFIKEGLVADSSIVIIDFNPWRFEEENQRILNFFQTLATSLQKEIHTRKERIGQIISQYSAYLTPLALTCGAGVGSLSISGGAQAIGVSLSSVTLDELKTRLESILKEEGKTVVIFVDDVDRMDNKEIRSLFKLIKISANFKNIIYVVAFDEKNVAKALSETYSDDRLESGMLFLEKIIQLPLHLPKITDHDMTNFALWEISESLKYSGVILEEDEIHQFGRSFFRGFEGKLKTPRILKRYCNSLKFSLPILKGEINYVDFMLIEGIRIIYPNLYSEIRLNPEYFLLEELSRDTSRVEVIKKHIVNIVESALEKDNEKDYNSVFSLLQDLFPRIATVNSNTYYPSDWDIAWQRKKKICSRDYFERYFIYSIPKGDLSDIKFEQFLKQSDSMSIEELSDNFNSSFNIDETAAFIYKIQFQFDKIPINCIGKLAIALAKNGTKYKKDDSEVFSFSTFDRSAFVIVQMLERISDLSERQYLARQVIEHSNPIDFTAEILRELKVGIEGKMSTIFSEEEGGELILTLKERIKALSNTENFFENYPKHVLLLFHYWGYGGSREEVREYVSQMLASNPEYVIKLLSIFSVKGWGANGPVYERLSSKSYSDLKEIVDPEFVVLAIKQIMGDVSLDEYNDEDDTIPTNTKILYQFLILHKKETQNNLDESIN